MRADGGRGKAEDPRPKTQDLRGVFSVQPPVFSMARNTEHRTPNTENQLRFNLCSSVDRFSADLKDRYTSGSCTKTEVEGGEGVMESGR
jgi:hypothetical protein